MKIADNVAGSRNRSQCELLTIISGHRISNVARQDLVMSLDQNGLSPRRCLERVLMRRNQKGTNSGAICE